MTLELRVLNYIKSNTFSLDNQTDIDKIKLICSWNDFLNICENFEKTGHIIENKKRDSYVLTDFGNSYLLEQIKDIEKQNELQFLELEKLKTDLKLNKWLLKTKWIPHIISLLSFLFAIYVYFESKNDSTKLKKRLEKIESIILTPKNESKK